MFMRKVDKAEARFVTQFRGRKILLKSMFVSSLKALRERTIKENFKPNSFSDFNKVSSVLLLRLSLFYGSESFSLQSSPPNEMKINWKLKSSPEKVSKHSPK